MTYDRWKTTEQEAREPAPTCDCCGERPARHVMRGCGLVAWVCDECADVSPECDVCGNPTGKQFHYTPIGAPICQPCWEESDEGVAFRNNQRTFEASFAGSR